MQIATLILLLALPALAGDGRFEAGFQQALNRPPTSGEIKLWGEIAGDSAFPGESRNAIRFAYHDVLQREPTPDELNQGAAKIDGGLSINRFWETLANCAEARFVVEFVAVARFVPSAEVRNFWVTRSGKFPSAQGYAQGDAALAAFPVNKDYAPFVDFVYRYLLGRAPNGEERSRDVARLESANDARVYFREIFSSEERSRRVASRPACTNLASICEK